MQRLSGRQNVERFYFRDTKVGVYTGLESSKGGRDSYYDPDTRVTTVWPTDTEVIKLNKKESYLVYGY